MNKSVVLVDIDGVLNDFLNSYIDTVIDLGYDFDMNYCSFYYLQQGIISPNKEKVHESIMNDPEFWNNIPTVYGAYDGLSYLNKRYEVWIATTPYSEKNKKEKIVWMNEKFPFISSKQIIFSDKKWKLNGDVIIEDKPETIENCNSVGIYTIMKYQPYNTDIKANDYLYSWDHIPYLMEHYTKEVLHDNY